MLNFFQDNLESIKEFKKIVDDARQILDQFSGDFVSNYTQDINGKLDEIGDTVKKEVGKLTEQLKDHGINSSLIPKELDEIVDLYDSTISLVSFSWFFCAVNSSFVKILL